MEGLSWAWLKHREDTYKEQREKRAVHVPPLCVRERCCVCIKYEPSLIPLGDKKSEGFINSYWLYSDTCVLQETLVSLTQIYVFGWRLISLKTHKRARVRSRSIRRYAVPRGLGRRRDPFGISLPPFQPLKSANRTPADRALIKKRKTRHKVRRYWSRRTLIIIVPLRCQRWMRRTAVMHHLTLSLFLSACAYMPRERIRLSPQGREIHQRARRMNI